MESFALPEAVDVAILGAGAAGMAAAHLCLAAGVTVAVLEADDRPGGRMRPIHGFAPDGRDIEAGAAYIHGDDNILYRHAQLQGWQLCPRVFPKWVHLPQHQSPGLPPARIYDLTDEEDEGAAALSEAIYSVVDLDLVRDDETYAGMPPDQDMTLAEYMLLRGADSFQIRVVDAVVCNDRCTSAARAGLREQLYADHEWPHGGGEIYPLHGLSRFGDDLARGLPIFCDHKVIKVAYDSDAGAQQPVDITIALPDGGSASLQCWCAVVTLPVPILRDEDVVFTPPLPLAKQEALSSVEAQPGVKAFLKFVRRVWPTDLTSLILVEGPFAEICTLPNGVNETDCNILSVFAMGTDATARLDCLDLDINRPPAMPETRWLELSPREQQILLAAVATMDKLWPDTTEARPATSSVCDFVSFDWGKHPYTRCAYTSPTVGAMQTNLREVLAAPVAGRIFFAGEATNPIVDVTVPGAIDTGLRAAREALGVLGARDRSSGADDNSHTGDLATLLAALSPSSTAAMSA